MDVNIVEEIIKSKSERVKYNSGFASYKRNLVFNNYAKIENNVATFYGSVSGDGYEISNTCMIAIDLKSRALISLSCDCESSMSAKVQVCSHMVAVVLQGIESIKNEIPKKQEGRIVNSKVSIEVANINENYIGIDLSFSGIDKSEYQSIFNSYKENKKMHRLKNGNYLDLRDDNISKALELIESLGINDGINNIKISSSKAIYMDKILKENDYKFVKCDNYIESIIQRYNQISKKNYEVPNHLNAKLRDYQVEGYKFLNTLSDFSFGGILADEMGLGKTIQVITFLLSKQNKKSIVIAPTALIYNWKNEIETFAPTLKVGLAYKDTKLRQNILEEVNKYDVILTTYGTLKNDIE